MGMTRQEKRFWAKVKRTKTCWLWTGALHANGYGGVRFNGKLQKAHRVAWELRNGPIPGGIETGFLRLTLFHKCGVRSCVRPQHMDLAPHGYSMVGRPQKVRSTRGRPRKLTSAQVAEIRELAPKRRYTEIARMFGVTSQTVSSIARGKTWRVPLLDGAKVERPRRIRWDAGIPRLWLHQVRLAAQARLTIPAIGTGAPRFR